MITDTAPELSEILHQADKACYTAKEQGRNRVCVYGQPQEHQGDPLADQDGRLPSWLQLH